MFIVFYVPQYCKTNIVDLKNICFKKEPLIFCRNDVINTCYYILIKFIVLYLFYLLPYARRTYTVRVTQRNVCCAPSGLGLKYVYTSCFRLHKSVFLLAHDRV